MSPSAALTGTLDDFLLPDLLALLAGTGQTGVVEFSGTTPGMIVLVGGELTLALSEAGPTLQQVAIGSGITTADGWESAHLNSLKGTPLVDALIAGGADPDFLGAVLYEQTVGAVFEFLLPSSDRFAFLPGATHRLGERYRLPVDEVLAAAEQRVEAWKIIAEAVPSTSMVMRLVRALPAESVTIDGGDWRVLSLVDGHASIATIVRTLGMSAFAVCGILHRLLQAGLVEAAPGT
jgi:Domain of unknown function (DUF4388)